MYLPKLLLDRFGWPGFIAFAVPNVLGCVAFGYVVKNRQRSEAMVKRHGIAMAAFSIVTIAYHILFLCILFNWLTQADPSITNGPVPWGGMALLSLAVLAVASAWMGDRGWLRASVAIYAASLLLCSIVAWNSNVTYEWRGVDPPLLLAWLAIPMFLGFLACPYLDLTFHRAIEQSSSRHAFAIFGFAFLVMILFTCFIWPSNVRNLAPLALAHILAQSVFTCGAHLRELRQRGLWARWIRRPAGWLALILLACAALFLFQSADTIESGNAAYLRSLGFYGLAFPAYVLLFIGPAPPLAASRPTLVIFALIVISFAPLYELAFIRNVTWVMMIPALAVGAWLIARRQRATTV